ncbi:MAG: hydantoinase/oxoprolinase family protein [Anaerolineales bacterium]|nr:hydantoinase/oxoprolinase family protein [Anaerolineales bacterium]
MVVTRPNNHTRNPTPWRLGVDIGGTFTDVALEGPSGRFIAKVLTTPSAPEAGVLTAIRQAMTAANLAPTDLSAIIHGTTLATNALIERKGARTALITTQGFRDVLHLGTESRFEQYDLYLEKPEPLVPRRLRFAVPERVNAQGEVLIPLDEAAVAAVIPALAEQAIESVAVAFLHSFANPAHEQRVRELLAAALPELSISLSCEVSPEIREYDRFSTTCANAYVQPRVARYLQNLEILLRESSFACPVFAFLSNGSLTDLETASRFPVRLIESGPAGGAVLAGHVAQQCGLESVISYDMGGTTAKLCLLNEARPRTAREFEVARMYRFKRGSGLPVRIPVIEMVEIGAGGGSLCQVNLLGLISVGPDSAGSEPGPACYGRSGSRATVTDANLLLGRIDPAAFAGGTLSLDPAAAEAAVDRDVAQPLGLPRPIAAQGIVEVVDENMANAAREHAAEQGQSLAGRTLIAFGGSAPLHAARLARKLGLQRIVIPSGAGVGSAIGFLRAPVAFELVRSRYQRLGSLDVALINTVLDEMTTEARTFVARGAPNQEVQIKRLAYMRYVGQRHEISVPLPPGLLQSGDAEKLRAAYDTAYLEQFGRIIPNLEIEVMSWSVAVSTLPPAIERLSETQPLTEIKSATTKLLFDFEQGAALAASVYPRSDLPLGAAMSGPALIVEAETTTVVPPGWRASVNGLGYIVLEATVLTSPNSHPE